MRHFTSDLRPVGLRNGLVFGQITLCTLLLVACGALLRTTMEMSTLDIGFRTDGLIAMEVIETARGAVLDALASDPAVDAIAAASSIPLAGLVPSVPIVTRDGSAMSAAYNYVSPTYFEMLRIPILRGRNFTPAETIAEASSTRGAVLVRVRGDVEAERRALDLVCRGSSLAASTTSTPSIKTAHSASILFALPP